MCQVSSHGGHGFSTYPHTHSHNTNFVTKWSQYRRRRAMSSARMKLLFSSDLKRSELHFGESQRVPVALPARPLHTVTAPGWVVAAAVVMTVQVGLMIAAVPPGTFVVHCTRAWIRVVILVWSAEHVVNMIYSQWVTFTQQREHWHVSLNSTAASV